MTRLQLVAVAMLALGRPEPGVYRTRLHAYTSFGDCDYNVCSSLISQSAGPIYTLLKQV